MRADRGDEDAWTTTLLRGFTRPASQPSRASRAGELVEQDLHVDPGKAYAYRVCWKHTPLYRTLLNGSCTSLPGTDGLGQPLSLARRHDPMSGLGGHAEVDRGDGISRRV